MKQVIIGIDVSTNPRKLGLACLVLEAESPTALQVTPGQAVDAATQICAWIQDADHVLLAVDAPLGWPARLSPALAEHRAGDLITDDPALMFQRDTDRFIHQTLAKRPLDVGADRIARTAHAALRLLAMVEFEAFADVINGENRLAHR